MNNPSNVLANTTVKIDRTNVTSDIKGGYSTVATPVATDVPAKIEHVQPKIPLKIAGKDYHSYYLMHIWADKNGLIQINDNDIIIDLSNNKTYNVIDKQVGSLGKKKPYKVEVKMEVRKDKNYTLPEVEL